ncbi:MutS2 family protein [Thalassoporum mexicanum PCC 7367]|uniref:endonuclease MutS2 n=1 Tax=Thalassoporum mexicanum TaxID=3457544 RepID=UPI00029FA70A|nr:endonuclease MutS2 [Pseudanabaena sp. PCC 7367]AFY70691.1 MutS2 family protein [Pseudanabaena sp. PCC 7367]
MQSETLELLEWSRLCEHLSTFAATKLGAVAARQLVPPDRYDRTLELLTQTKEVSWLESTLLGGLTMEGIQDITVPLKRVEKNGMLYAEQLWQVATTLAGARNLRRIIDNADDCEYLQAFVSELRTYPELEQDIYRCIDESGTVLDRASEKLGQLRASSRQVRDRIYGILQNIMQRKSAALQENIITQRSDRYVLSVKAPQKDKIPGVVHDASSTGMTVFVEPHAIVTANNQLRQLAKQEQAEIEIILRQLSGQVAEVGEDLWRLLAIVTEIDLAIARARYALWLGANAPTFINFAAPDAATDIESNQKESASQSSDVDQLLQSESDDPGNSQLVEPGDRPATSSLLKKPASKINADLPPAQLTLRGLKHPLLVWQQQHEQGREVVPVDVLIAPEISVVVITGPNTGGKTATLKTFGLAALMAKSGMFVPAREPVELPWFDLVLADIGDEQSLQQNLSTFSGHIKRIGRILTAATAESLILLDEVGAGTDPTEGSAIAKALLEYLATHACLTVATTHFGELKTLKYNHACFENAAVEFDDVKLAPTYRLQWGIPGRSNALAIAARLGFPAEILEQAQDHVGFGSAELNTVIADLEGQRRKHEDKLKQASKLLAQTEHLYVEISKKAAKLKESERELRQNQEIEVTEAIKQAKKEIARVIRKLQKGDSPEAVHFAERRVQELSKRHLPSQQPQPKTQSQAQQKYVPKVGDRVRVPKLGQVVQVLSEPTNADELSVRLGQMKMTVALRDIEKV